MKKPERLVGFVSYEEKLFPFEFDEKEFKVNLYPPTREIWEQYSSVALTLERLQQTLETSNEWISYGELLGKSQFFCVFPPRQEPWRCRPCIASGTQNGIGS